MIVVADCRLLSVSDSCYFTVSAVRDTILLFTVGSIFSLFDALVILAVTCLLVASSDDFGGMSI